MNCFRILGAVVFIFAFASCASTGLSSSGLMIDEIKIANRSSSDVEGFRLSVPRSGAVVATNRILQGREFLNGVEAFPYKGNAVSLRWFQDGEKFEIEGLKIRDDVESSTPVTVVIELLDAGRIDAYVS